MARFVMMSRSEVVMMELVVCHMSYTQLHLCVINYRSRVAILFVLFTVTSPVRVFADSAVAVLYIQLYDQGASARAACRDGGGAAGRGASFCPRRAAAARYVLSVWWKEG